MTDSSNSEPETQSTSLIDQIATKEGQKIIIDGPETIKGILIRQIAQRNVPSDEFHDRTRICDSPLHDSDFRTRIDSDHHRTHLFLQQLRHHPPHQWYAYVS